MTELDDLRRVAYGRTSSPAEEAAAAAARAELAAHERRLLQVRAEREAAEFAQARGIDVHAPAESEAPGGVTVDVVEVDDERGYARRHRATWRVWAGPAFVAFVFGVVLTVASGVLVLNAQRLGDGSSTGTEIVVGEPTTLAIGSGNLQAATAELSTPRDAEDAVPNLDAQLDPSTTHLLRATTAELTYAAMSLDGKICLIVRWVDDDDAPWTCTVPSGFPAAGLAIGRADNEETVMLHWDGVTVTETRTPQ
jgi:hypothetical protein